MPTGYSKISLVQALLVGAQWLAAPIVCIAILIAATRGTGSQFGDEYVALAIISALVLHIFLRGQMGTGERGVFLSRWTIVNRVAIAWIGTVAALLLIGYATKISAVYSRRALFLWFVATPPFLAATLIVLRQWLRSVIVSSGESRSVIIAGLNSVSFQLAKSIAERPELGLKVKGFFDDRGPDRLGTEIGDMSSAKMLGKLTDLPAYLHRERVDTVFVAIPLSHVQRTKDLLDELRDSTASIYFVPDIFAFELIQARTDDVNGIPIVALCETPFHGWRGVLKRLSDIVLASSMLLIAAPIMALIAIGLKLTTKGPVIFKQRRYGLDGEEFVVYKFRTMSVEEDGANIPQATKDDRRITPFGRLLRRYSLDELPQLINVLQGRMSVVGPRPHAVAHNEEYRKLISGYMMRHKVAPGITGLAQVNGCRGETATVQDMKRRIDYDLEYLRHWSLTLDLKILLRTLAIWFKDEKAY